LPDVTIKSLLEAGVHFGHQTRRWNPKMKRFIFEERNGIHILDLQKTTMQLSKAGHVLRDIVLRGGSVLFVGTKKQAKETIYRASTRCGMYYVNERWLGGTLTNNITIRKSIGRLRELETMALDGTFEKLKKKEVARLLREKAKLHKYLDGIKEMAGLPEALFVVDTRRDRIAVAEASKMGIPVVAMVDSNGDPDLIDYPIPANDDAIKSVSLMSNVVADYIVEAQNQLYKSHPEAVPGRKPPRPTGETESPVARRREDQSTEKADAETPAPASAEPQASDNSSEKDERQSTSETVSEPTTEKKGN
jgi:small subunit ribosomal protein S2